jgi:hypothetical protein
VLHGKHSKRISIAGDGRQAAGFAAAYCFVLLLFAKPCIFLFATLLLLAAVHARIYMGNVVVDGTSTQCAGDVFCLVVIAAIYMRFDEFVYVPADVCSSSSMTRLVFSTTCCYPNCPTCSIVSCCALTTAVC